MRVVMLGSGAVANALGAAFAASQCDLVQIYARNAAVGKALAEKCGCTWAGTPPELAEADLYILAVSEPAINRLSSQLNFGSATVAHTAGSAPIEELAAKIKNKAVFYPLQTFTKGRNVDMQEVPILIEGSTPAALKCVREAASAISADVRQVNSADRRIVHLAAVFACNFSNHMYAIGEEMLQPIGQGFDLLKPLIRETARKAIETGAPKKCQTGPAVRNDFATRNKHSELLTSRPDYKNIYTALSSSIWEISKKR